MVWGPLIAIYLFLAGLGAGAYILGAWTSFAKAPKPTVKLIAYIVAPIAIAVGTLLLMIDAKAGLHNPLRFFYLISNPSSVMSWGVIILSVFLVVSIINLIVLLVKKNSSKALDIIGLVVAVFVAAYTGVLLGDAGLAFPLWNIVILPILFTVSALSTGIAIVFLIGYFKASEEIESIYWHKKSGIVLPLLELILIALLLVVTARTTGAGAAAAAATISNLLSGSYALAFWGALIIVGLVIPFVLHIVKIKRSRAVASDEEIKTASSSDVLSTICILVGGFTLRYLIVMAAIPIVFAG